jgi:hypothetical protein
MRDYRSDYCDAMLTIDHDGLCMMNKGINLGATLRNGDEEAPNKLLATSDISAVSCVLLLHQRVDLSRDKYLSQCHVILPRRLPAATAR